MNFLEKTSQVSARQFGVFRILFGLYLSWHFAALIPYAVELFSDIGILGAEGAHPFIGSWPNPLFLQGSHHWVTPLLGAAVVASLSFTLGFLRRSSALFLCVVLGSFFTANPLIVNPCLGYVGMLLLLCAVIPAGEGYGLSKQTSSWQMPLIASFTVWFLLATGYSFSGYLKLGSPSWLDGSALQHVLASPLARPGLLREMVLGLPDIMLQFMTWGVLLLELLFVPLALFKKTRFWAWSLMLLMHLGIMTMVDLADLSMGMVMVHLFTFQRSWLPARRSIAEQSHLLFIDADCAFCQQSTRILSSIDSQEVLRFSTLQGETASIIPEKSEEITAAILLENPQSPDQKKWQGADAILRSFYLCGGVVSLLWVFRFIPTGIKNRLYDFIAKHRHLLRIPFTSKQCKLLTPEQQKRYLP